MTTVPGLWATDHLDTLSEVLATAGAPGEHPYVTEGRLPRPRAG